MSDISNGKKLSINCPQGGFPGRSFNKLPVEFLSLTWLMLTRFNSVYLIPQRLMWTGSILTGSYACGRWGHKAHTNGALIKRVTMATRGSQCTLACWNETVSSTCTANVRHSCMNKMASQMSKCTTRSKQTTTTTTKSTVSFKEVVIW